MSMQGGEPAGYAELFSRGISVRDNFLTPSLVGELLECARRRYGRGEFSAARIGADRRAQVQAAVRGDSTCWLAEPLEAAERLLQSTFEQLRLALNREGYLGLFAWEAHYARYAAGTGYMRHVDQLMGREQRQVSLVVYLNPAWCRADGGQLRVFDADGTHLDIEPRSGRLVCFITAGREHEVLQTRAERWSITAWYRRRP